MTKDEKLKKALEALKLISETATPSWESGHAKMTLKEITAPRMETVEIKRWLWNYFYPRPLQCPEITDIEPVGREKHCWIELTGTYQRPVEKKEEVWEGWLVALPGGGIGMEHDVEIPDTLAGRRVEFRLKEAE